MQFEGLIGLGAMLYKSLYPAREIETIKLSSNCLVSNCSCLTIFLDCFE